PPRTQPPAPAPAEPPGAKAGGEADRETRSAQAQGKTRAAAPIGQGRAETGRKKAGGEEVRSPAIRRVAEKLGIFACGNDGRRNAGEPTARGSTGILAAQGSVGKPAHRERTRHGPPPDRRVLERAGWRPRRKRSRRRDQGNRRSRRDGSAGDDRGSGSLRQRSLLSRRGRKRAPRLLQPAMPATAPAGREIRDLEGPCRRFQPQGHLMKNRDIL